VNPGISAAFSGFDFGSAAAGPEGAGETPFPAEVPVLAEGTEGAGIGALTLALCLPQPPDARRKKINGARNRREENLRGLISHTDFDPLRSVITRSAAASVLFDGSHFPFSSPIYNKTENLKWKLETGNWKIHSLLARTPRYSFGPNPPNEPVTFIEAEARCTKK
jgi:hypothetical protein